MPLDINLLTIKTSLLPGGVKGAEDGNETLKTLRQEMAKERELLMQGMMPVLRDSLRDRLNR